MSGHASYADALNEDKYGEPHHVPIVIATEESLRGYGRIVRDFDAEEVWITTWPQQGSRRIQAGTGRAGGVTSGDFLYEWRGEYLTAVNKAVADGDYITGRLPASAKKESCGAPRKGVLVREANYHPDGGQVFFPMNNEPFVALLALPGDDIKMEDFKAFYFDGTFGVQIKPSIWHQPVYPIPDKAVFRGKQGRVHACVCMDTVEEFNKYMYVPLQLKDHQQGLRVEKGSA
eukprot:Nk52_evm6s2391 gene=Nk52_evmTU6s2391